MRAYKCGGEKCNLKTQFQMLLHERASAKEKASFPSGKGIPGHLLVRGKVPNPIWMGEAEIVSSKGNFVLIVKLMGLLHFLLEAQEKEFELGN